MNGSTPGVKLHGRTKLRSWEVCGLSASLRERSAKFASGFPGPLRARFLTRGTHLKPSEAVLPELFQENRTRLLDSFRRLVRSALRLCPAEKVPKFSTPHFPLLGKWRQQHFRLSPVGRALRFYRAAFYPAARIPWILTLRFPLLEKWRRLVSWSRCQRSVPQSAYSLFWDGYCASAF